MNNLQKITYELDEMYILDNVTGIHDDIRNQYGKRKRKVENDMEFDHLIADYYNYHYTNCITFGGKMPLSQAGGKAKAIIANVYAKKGMTILQAYNDGKSGRNGGMYKILDSIAEYIKTEAMENHVRSVLDRYIPRSSWEEKVSIMRQIMNAIPGESNFLEKSQPERYASNYEDFVRGYVEHINHEKSKYRNF